MCKVLKMSNSSEKLKSQYRSCLDCKSDILQKNPSKCPYCGSLNLTDEEEQLANSPSEATIDNAGNYKKAANYIQSSITKYFKMLKQILDQPIFSFAESTMEQVPSVSGVYVIYDNSSNQMIYAGKTKNLKVHLLKQHQKGNIKDSKFRKALARKFSLENENQVTNYVRKNCSFKLIELESLTEMLRLEHFITAVMAPVLNTQLKQ